jgi:hypothetical protein
MKRLTAALCAVGFQLWGTPVDAQSAQRPVRPWLEEQFTLVGQSCNPTFAARGGTVVPADVRRLIGPEFLAANAQVYPRASLNSFFGRVYLRAGTSLTDLPPLAMPFSQADALIVDGDLDNLVRRNNCATLLSADADTKFNLNLAAVRTALSAAATSTTSETAFVYSGRLVSPIAVAVDRYPSLTATPQGVDRFSAWLAVWWWYIGNPDRIAAGALNQLEITSYVDGIAVYRYEGLQQSVLLNGSVSAAAAVPFISIRGSGQGRLSSETNSQGSDFGIAVIDQRTNYLPSAQTVANEAPAFARFTSAESNPRTIENGSPIRLSYALAGVPQPFCQPNRWYLASQQPGGDGHLTPSDVEVEWTSGRCTFTLEAKPASAPQTSGDAVVEFSLNVPLSGAPVGSPNLVITSPKWRLADNRAAITVSPANNAGVLLVLPNLEESGVPLPILQVSYPIQERQADRLTTGVSVVNSALTVTCGTAGARSLTIPPAGMIWSRTASSASLTLAIPLPIDLVPADDSISECRLDGQAALSVQNVTQPGPASLPTYAFRVRRTVPVATR